ncbi:MAG: TonB-dependent receptor [Bacteroidota bacterium]
MIFIIRLKGVSVLACLLLAFAMQAQEVKQNIRGIVQDADAEYPLIGATVTLLNVEPVIASVTDADGSFKLEGVPVGRQSLEIRYLGYETAYLSNLVVTSGKEMILTINLRESTQQLQEVVVKATDAKQQPLNEMAAISARSFSVEETQRYAASLLDPARMAQNYAGVTSSGDDLSNEIVIRGNSPAYVQWRIEGLQVPGPNHFAAKGSSGGGISMLSSSMLTNSDFYTGAFPAEIGNTLAGAFDLRFRNGNNEKREYAFMLGVIGTEVSMEGPFSSNSKASYLINYRYSTLKMLDQVGLSPVDIGDTDLDFQDISFKFNFPTRKAGNFSLFGLGGLTRTGSVAEADTTQWDDLDDIWTFREDGNYGMLGLSHRYLFPNNQTYIKTVVGMTFDQYLYDDSFFDVERDYERVADEIIEMTDKYFRASVTLNHKFNARHTLRAGGIFSNLGYEFTYDERNLDYQGNYRFLYGDPFNILSSDGNTNLIQTFAQWKYRISDRWTMNAGLHSMYFALNDNYSIEPRANIRYQLSPKQSLTLAAGLHSQQEHLVNYLADRTRADGSVYQPNRDLELTKAAHFVLGYDHAFSKDVRLKIETYYQHLYDLPLDTSSRAGSIVNAANVFDVLFGSNVLQSLGTGRNMGIDLTLEKFYSQGYYAMLTASLFDSKFENAKGQIFNTRYNARYNVTALGGKEWNIGKQKQNALAVNGKVIFSGGNRYSEIDWDKSIEQRRVIITEDGIYKNQVRPYSRIDLSARYSINKAKATHSIALEVQNVLNQDNVANVWYDFSERKLREFYQTGLIPNFNYRIEF